jgi:hypothetical protein
MALVLCTGVDPVLLETRRLILDQAGHTVVTAMNLRDLTSACENHRFEVAVIGQTVSAAAKRLIASQIRTQCPSARILELYPPYLGRALDDADSWLEVPADVPQQLAARVTELAKERRDEASDSRFPG